MTINLRKFYLTLIFGLFSTVLLAQPEDPPADDDPAAAAPIDNYLILLAATGVGYVYYTNKKKLKIVPVSK